MGLKSIHTCVANKQIDGYQMTFVWHVNDLKVSHKKPEEMTKLAIIYPKYIEAL